MILEALWIIGGAVLLYCLVLAVLGLAIAVMVGGAD
jgi:hypothetical protein